MNDLNAWLSARFSNAQQYIRRVQFDFKKMNDCQTVTLNDTLRDFFLHEFSVYRSFHVFDETQTKLDASFKY